MSSSRIRFAAVAIVACLVVPPVISGCSSSGNASDATRSAAASLATDPAVMKARATLKANFDNDFTAQHPYASLKKVLQESFPGVSSADIITFGLKTFKLKDRHPGADQNAWFDGVVLFAMNKSATGIPSGAATPPIPGVTSPAASPVSTATGTTAVVVHAGAFCKTAGAVGMTSTGRNEVCRISATDSKLRWRSS